LMTLLVIYENKEDILTTHELTKFFTIFVMLQFWNLFNVRVFGTNESTFKGISKSYGMEIIALAILIGQYLIVEFGGDVFRTDPLSWKEWASIILSTSVVLWIGEFIRWMKRIKNK